MKLVRVEQAAAGVGRVTLDRPERRNAVNEQMAEEFAEAVAVLSRWGVWSAVLDAEGPAFCAGADLSEPDTAAAAVESLISHLVEAPVHWTAVVQGAVRGAGLGVLAMCPRVLAGPAATFGLPEIALGFFPTDLLEGPLAGRNARAYFELAFAGDPVSAQTALRMGLVSDVLAAEDLAAEGLREAERLGRHGRDAVLAGVSLWQQWGAGHRGG